MCIGRRVSERLYARASSGCGLLSETWRNTVHQRRWHLHHSLRFHFAGPSASGHRTGGTKARASDGAT